MAYIQRSFIRSRERFARIRCPTKQLNNNSFEALIVCFDFSFQLPSSLLSVLNMWLFTVHCICATLARCKFSRCDGICFYRRDPLLLWKVPIKDFYRKAEVVQLYIVSVFEVLSYDDRCCTQLRPKVRKF